MKRILFILLGIFACVNIYLWPKNKYEWMGDAVNQWPEDENTGIYQLLTILPILVFFICAWFIKKKQERLIAFSGSLLLVILWVYKFW